MTTKNIPIGAVLLVTIGSCREQVTVSENKNDILTCKFGNSNADISQIRVLAELADGEAEFVLDDFTKHYLVAALWSSSDEYDNNRRDAKEAGCTVDSVPTSAGKLLWSYAGPGENASEKNHQFEYEQEAWNAAYEEFCGGGCNDTSLDENYDIEDFSVGALIDSIEDCLDFQKAQGKLLVEYYERIDRGDHEDSPRAFAGHDFWLSRNGHGAGYFDRGLGKIGNGLQDAARVYGSVNITVGDDGKLHI